MPKCEVLEIISNKSKRQPGVPIYEEITETQCFSKYNLGTTWDTQETGLKKQKTKKKTCRSLRFIHSNFRHTVQRSKV